MRRRLAISLSRAFGQAAVDLVQLAVDAGFDSRPASDSDTDRRCALIAVVMPPKRPEDSISSLIVAASAEASGAAGSGGSGSRGSFAPRRSRRRWSQERAAAAIDPAEKTLLPLEPADQTGTGSWSSASSPRSRASASSRDAESPAKRMDLMRRSRGQAVPGRVGGDGPASPADDIQHRIAIQGGDQLPPFVQPPPPGAGRVL